MILLKDGTTVNDPRFGRLVSFDEKSKDHPVRTLVETKEPRSYTWRCVKTLDQGNEGACAGFGVTAELICRPVEVQGVGFSDAMLLYHMAQKIDEWPGGSYEDAVPYYEGTSVLAAMKAAQVMGWFDSYVWSFSLEDLILGIGYNGPAVMGMNWYEGMIETDRQGFIHPTGELGGGHCVLCRGVNISREYFTIRNSWGAGWGRCGDCYISFEDMQTLLNQDGEAVFALGRYLEV